MKLLQYKLKQHCFEPPYSPYYDKYKGHTFIIVDYMAEDELRQHVKIKCIDDPNMTCDRYVHTFDLEEIQ